MSVYTSDVITSANALGGYFLSCLCLRVRMCLSAGYCKSNQPISLKLSIIIEPTSGKN